MKKILLCLICSVFVIANPLEFKTLNSEFTQIVKSQDTKIEYSGNFIATNKNAFWHYEKPNLKDIYFSFEKVIVIEPELEQAIITNVKEVPNITDILQNAKQDKNGNFLAKFDDINYLIHIENNKITKITYTDKMDNDIELIFLNLKKNSDINESLLIPQIPNNFDVITQ